MKKILYLAAMALMILFLTAACGDDNGAGDANMPDDSPDRDTQAPPAADVSEFVPFDADMDGHIFRVLGFGNEEGSWIAGTYSDIWAESITGDTINDAIYHRNRRVEELYNIEIALTPWPQSDSPQMAGLLVRAIRAGDDEFDAALISGSSLPSVLNMHNSLLDLNEVSTLDLSRSYWDQQSRRDLAIGGRNFAVIGDISLYSFFANTIIYFNKTLIEDYSLDNPYELVRNGEWTWDKLHSMARQVTRDLTGDGTIGHEDQIGFLSETAHQGTIYLTTGERMTRNDADGIPHLALGGERSIRAYNFAFDLLTDPTSTFLVGNAPGTFANPFHEWATPKFYRNEVLFFYNQLLVTFELRNMDADFGILPPPKFDAAQDRFYTTSANWFLTHTVIPITSANPERTGIILDALCYYSQQLVRSAFFDVAVTHRLTRDEDSLEMLNIIRENRIFDMAFIFNWQNMAWDLFAGIVASGNNTFVSRLDAVGERIQAAIEATVDEILGG